LPLLFPPRNGGAGRGGLSPKALAAALDYIGSHPQIWEVILTGGDPLMLSARRLKDVVAKACAIPTSR
jgi:lysine 2,3-aminomutase